MRRGPYTDHANRRQVLEATGIDENKKMVTSATTSMRAHGFYIGAKVTLKWRISKNFTPDKYCDINVGEVGFIKGEKSEFIDDDGNVRKYGPSNPCPNPRPNPRPRPKP